MTDPKTYPPAKPEDDQHGWDHLVFAPEWTDPDWVDPTMYGETIKSQDAGHGDENSNSGFQPKDPIRPVRVVPLGRTLRPAQLVQDEIRNPTPYARRFGIGPGRTDGRSGLSPTAEVQKTFPRTGQTLTAEEAINQIRAVAAQRGVGPTELLEELTKTENFAQLSEKDQFVVQFNNEIQQDRDWQSIFFEDMTTDEIIREGIFGIYENNDHLPLDNEIHKETTFHGNESPKLFDWHRVY
ncbi:hypothetical protein ACHAQH_006703 [Verticillium albo-atrum]